MFWNLKLMNFSQTFVQCSCATVIYIYSSWYEALTRVFRPFQPVGESWFKFSSKLTTQRSTRFFKSLCLCFLKSFRMLDPQNISEDNLKLEKYVSLIILKIISQVQPELRWSFPGVCHSQCSKVFNNILLNTKQLLWTTHNLPQCWSKRFGVFRDFSAYIL